MKVIILCWRINLFWCLELSCYLLFFRAPVIFNNGFKYYVVFVDHFTRYVWLYPLKTKVLTFTMCFSALRLSLKNFSSISLPLSITTMVVGCQSHNGFSKRRHCRHIVEMHGIDFSVSCFPLHFALWSIYLWCPPDHLKSFCSNFSFTKFEKFLIDLTNTFCFLFDFVCG